MINIYPLTNIYEKPLNSSKLSSQMIYGEKFSINTKNKDSLKITNKTIKEGVDYPNLENVMNSSWETEVIEHNGNQAEAYKCLRKNVKNQVLHGWIINHLPDGRGTVGTKIC